MNPINRRPRWLIALLALLLGMALQSHVTLAQVPDETSPNFQTGGRNAIVASGVAPSSGSGIVAPEAFARNIMGSFLGAFLGTGFETLIKALCDTILKLLRDLQNVPGTETASASTTGTSTGGTCPTLTGTATGTKTGTATRPQAATSTSTGSSTGPASSINTGTATEPTTDQGEIETRYAGSPIPRGQQQSPIPGFSGAKSPNSRVVAKANQILKRNLPIGSTVQFTIDGKVYLARMEWHKHAPTDNVSAALKDWHHGVTVYQQK